MTEAERQSALEAVAAEVRVCRRCRLHQGRTQAVPGEGHPGTEVVLVGEGPGFNEDRLGRPFVGRAGDLLVQLLASIGWRREEVFITNIVKCRPPDNRDPAPDEIAACMPYLHRQLEILDPSLVVTLGRHSMARFMPGTSISRAHGTVRPADPAGGAPNALVMAMYHPAAALRTPALEEACRVDARQIPQALEDARARRVAGTVESPVEQHEPAERLASPAAPLDTPAEPLDTPAEPLDTPAEPLETAAEQTTSAAEPLETALQTPEPTNPPVGISPANPPAVAPLSGGEPGDDQLTLF